MAEKLGPAKVVFACVANAGRSQMAAALFNTMADPHRARAISAGTRPGTAVHPEVVTAMRELGIDLSGRTPRALDQGLAEEADVVVTMGCGDECPYIPGKRYVDWELEDPAGQPLEKVRSIRDEIAKRVEQLVKELDEERR